jgi:uncharacterized peroxidase-related enzyme
MYPQLRNIGNILFILERDFGCTRSSESAMMETKLLEELMARISLINPESATAEVKEIYEKALRGKPGNAQKALAHRPELLKNFLPFYASVGRSLDRKLYELIYLRVSRINGCHYCTQHHVASSKRLGLTADDWSALKAGDDSRYSEKERATLIYVEKLTRTPHDITDRDFAPLKKHFSEPEIVDIHLLTGLANLTNRFTDPLGLEVEFPEEKI